MDVMPDPDLDQAREAMRAAMEVAERAMVEHARDPERFEAAGREFVKAEAELRRLDFIARHSAEVAEADAAHAKRAELEAAQQRGRDAHQRAAQMVARIRPLVVDVEELLSDLKDAQVLIDRGVHFETFGVRDGLIPRATIPAKLPVDAELAVRLLRAARDLVRLSSMSLTMAEMKANQRSAGR